MRQNSGAQGAAGCREARFQAVEKRTSRCRAVLITRNVYRRFWVTDQSEQHYLWVGRITGLLIVLLGIHLAFVFASVVEGLEIFWALQAMMGIVFWAGIFWRRATPAGAWAGMTRQGIFRDGIQKRSGK